MSNLSTHQGILSLQAVTQVSAILLTGLITGLFYGYDCSVIKGLGQLPDREYLSAFQSINKMILNPYFFFSFMGTFFLLPLTTWLSYRQGISPSFYFLLASMLVYLIGTFAVTIMGNVPLNTMLEQADLVAASGDELQRLRQTFEGPWNSLHHMRTYASMLSFLLAILSLFKST